MVWVLGNYPVIFHFLFGSWIGNVVLFFGVAWLISLDYALGILVASVVLLLCMTTRLEKKREGFLSESSFVWPSSLLQQFQANHRFKLYDLNVLQKQATASEVESFLYTDKWPWSKEVKDMYKDYIRKSYMIQIDPMEALKEAQRVYNQAAILDLMAINSKEGSFLLNGVVVGHTPGLPANRNNLIVCDSEKQTLVKKMDLGYSGIWGNILEQVEPVSDPDVENQIDGFHFLDGPCNPCSQSCPFSLDVGDGGEISPIWQYKWKKK